MNCMRRAEASEVLGRGRYRGSRRLPRRILRRRDAIERPKRRVPDGHLLWISESWTWARRPRGRLPTEKMVCSRREGPAMGDLRQGDGEFHHEANEIRDREPQLIHSREFTRKPRESDIRFAKWTLTVQRSVRGCRCGRCRKVPNIPSRVLQGLERATAVPSVLSSCPTRDAALGNRPRQYLTCGIMRTQPANGLEQQASIVPAWDGLSADLHPTCSRLRHLPHSLHSGIARANSSSQLTQAARPPGGSRPARPRIWPAGFREAQGILTQND